MGNCAKRRNQDEVQKINGNNAADITGGGVDPLGLLPFFKGDGQDNLGRSLKEQRQWDDSKLEKQSDYIQWWFPTNDVSGFNSAAPLLTPSLAQEFANDPECMENLRLNLARFSTFLGLQYQHGGEEGAASFDRGANFKKRTSEVWKRGRGGTNHNWMRISRVLCCLGLVGMKQEQQALLRCLEKLVGEGLKVGASMGFWKKNAQVSQGWS